MGDPLYPASKLDGNQVLQHAFNDQTQRLRTDAEATIVNADVDVSLVSTEDSVAIGDQDGNLLNINPDGSINVIVNTAGTGRSLASKYTEVTGIANGVTTLIGTFTATTNSFLQKIDFSGENIGEYELVIGGITQDKKRTYFSGGLNGCFDFNDGLSLLPGQVVQVYVVHYQPDVGDFNSRIQTLQG